MRLTQDILGVNLSAVCSDYSAATSSVWTDQYSTTFWFSSVQAWQNGLKLDSFFGSYPDYCITDFTNSMNEINGLYLLETINGGNYTIAQVVIYIGYWISGPIDNLIYDCWSFQQTVITDIWAWYLTFLSFSDLYTSFLFNLLAESLQIRNYALDLTTYQEDNECVFF